MNSLTKALARAAASWGLGVIVASVLRATGQLDANLPIVACAAPATLFGLAAYAGHQLIRSKEG
ncbi:hypothetical protein [Streptomyces prunicolor]